MNNSMMTMSEIDSIDISGFIKKVLVLCLAVMMTMMLFYAMYMLIKNDQMPESIKPTPPIPNVNLTIPKEIPIQQEVKIVKPVEQKLPPRIIVPNTIDADTKPGIPTVDPVIVEPPKITGVLMNGQSLPIVKVAPVYPNAAATKGIEGFVDVVFDVTETGATENIQIVYAEPSTIFNSAVLKSVARWKYKPKMEDGVAMKMYGLRDRIRFKL